MTQNTTAALPPLRTVKTAPRPSAPVEDAAPREKEPARTLDKYDPSTIPCTD